MALGSLSLVQEVPGCSLHASHRQGADHRRAEEVLPWAPHPGGGPWVRRYLTPAVSGPLSTGCWQSCSSCRAGNRTHGPPYCWISTSTQCSSAGSTTSPESKAPPSSLSSKTPTRPVWRPPFSIDLFSQEQLALMSDYVVNTYFRHFKLYKYAFTPQVRLDISLSYVGMPEPELEPAAELAGELAESVMVPVPPAQEEEADSGTTAPRESPRALLQEYISAQLCQELAQLRLEVEEQLRASEEQFNTKLALLEKVSSSPKGGGRGHRK
nr:coiled-coil domain-containing protein 189 isoform X3 [Chelonoidis abingdonii]